MSKRKLKQIEKQIRRIKQELQEMGEMRPGSLTRQYRVLKDRIGSYYQISYTHKMKSHTEYVRPGFVKQLRAQIATYKRFKRLVEKWIQLAIKHSKLTMDIAKHKGLK